MSKKNNQTSDSYMPSEQMVEETNMVKKDLLQTIAVNILFIAILIGLYYWNLNNGQPLDHWVANLVK